MHSERQKMGSALCPKVYGSTRFDCGQSSRRNKMNKKQKILPIGALVLFSVIVALYYIPSWMPAGLIPSPPQITGNREDFKTINGKQYKDVTVTRVEIDGITVKTKSGISKLFFVELPKEVQKRFHYNPKQAARYSAAQAAAYEVYQKQQEEIRRQQEEADARNYVAYLQQQAANRNAQESADQALIQQQQNARANQPQPEHTYNGNAAISLFPVVRPQPCSPHK